jgi:enoyl reductase-like protein
MSDPLHARAKSLEDAYFNAVEEKAIAALKEKMERAYTKKDLQQLTGITNEQVLDKLADLKIGGAAVLVMSFFPMIAVAWADGQIRPQEKDVILRLVASMGVQEGSAAYEYLNKWLVEKPEPAWMRLWTEYVQALCEKMKPEDRALLKNTVVGRARVVAEAAGGILGVLWNVSQAEKHVIEQLEKAFA